MDNVREGDYEWCDVCNGTPCTCKNEPITEVTIIKHGRKHLEESCPECGCCCYPTSKDGNPDIYSKNYMCSTCGCIFDISINKKYLKG